MRKDVQLGLAIGGVFLAVLIVWGLVVSGGNKKSARQAVKLDTTGSTAGNVADRSSDIPPAVTAITHAPDAVTPPVAVNSDVPAVAPAATPAPSTAPSDGAVADADKPASDKKEANWSALILSPHPENLLEAAHTTTPPLAATATDTAAAASPAQPAAPAATHAPTADDATPHLSAADSTTPPAVANSVAPAPTTAPTEAASQGGATSGTTKTHIVQRNENFYTISKAVYGDGRYFTLISKANPTVDPQKLRPGMVINLPDAAQVKSSTKSEPAPAARSSAAHSAASPSAGGPAVDPKSEYRVASGDNLYKISIRLYGSGEEVEHLYDLNKTAIGPDKSHLKLGMVLKLPAAPTAMASR